MRRRDLLQALAGLPVVGLMFKRGEARYTATEWDETYIEWPEPDPEPTLLSLVDAELAAIRERGEEAVGIFLNNIRPHPGAARRLARELTGVPATGPGNMATLAKLREIMGIEPKGPWKLRGVPVYVQDLTAPAPVIQRIDQPALEALIEATREETGLHPVPPVHRIEPRRPLHWNEHGFAIATRPALMPIDPSAPTKHVVRGHSYRGTPLPYEQRIDEWGGK